MKYFDKEEVGIIKLSVEECEKTSRLTSEVLKILYEKKYFKLYLHKKYNGMELDITEGLPIIEEAAYLYGSLGWAIAIGAGAGYFSSYLDEQIADKIFSPKNSLISGSGAPTGTAEFSDDGYIVNGKWKYNSGSEYASMFSALAMMKNINGIDKNNQLACLLEPHQVSINKNWDSMGMKATSSNSIEVKEQFIPNCHTFRLDEKPKDPSYKLHQFPFLQFAQATFVPVIFGLFDRFIELAGVIIQMNKSKWRNYFKERLDISEEIISVSSVDFKQYKDEFYGMVNNKYEEFLKSDDISNINFYEISSSSVSIMNYAYKQTSDLFRHLGMDAVMKYNEINRTWRDLITTSQHILLKPYSSGI